MEASLVARGGAREATPRFRMLETIREFGLEQLATSGEGDAVMQRLADWEIVFATEADEHMYRSGAAALRVKPLEAEHDNLRSGAGLGARSATPADGRAVSSVNWVGSGSFGVT